MDFRDELFGRVACARVNRDSRGTNQVVPVRLYVCIYGFRGGGGGGGPSALQIRGHACEVSARRRREVDQATVYVCVRVYIPVAYSRVVGFSASKGIKMACVHIYREKEREKALKEKLESFDGSGFPPA